MDPLALRLALTKNLPGAHAVIAAVGEMADWRRKRDGRGLGIAFADYHDSFAASVAEVSLDRASGRIKVHNY
jgi:isoquinoline 1-oxidoreductase beta subunit